MRHNKHRASLGVTREHRKAMLANMAVSLLEHGRIKTTLTKAKALRPFVEKVITKAKKASVKTTRRTPSICVALPSPTCVTRPP